MIKELEPRIRERAHKIWESEGRPADRAEVHWSMASAEIAAEVPEAPAKPRVGKTASATPKAEKPSKAKAATKPKASKG